MESSKNSHRGLKICAGVTTLFLIILVVVLVVLFLTILKPKQPETSAYPVSLQEIEFGFFPALKLNVTLGLIVTVTNRNYGSFKYKDATAYVHYHGTVVAQAPIDQDTIPAHGKHNITTSVGFIADELVSNPHFWEDVGTGRLNLTSSTTLHGTVNVFKILKLHAIAYTSCQISVFLLAEDVDSKCNSRIKI